MNDFMHDLVVSVKSHALDHYNEGGWDIIVECYTNDDIADMIRDEGAKTPADAIAAVGKVAALKDDYRKDICGCVW